MLCCNGPLYPVHSSPELVELRLVTCRTFDACLSAVPPDIFDRPLQRLFRYESYKPGAESRQAFRPSGFEVAKPNSPKEAEDSYAALGRLLQKVITVDEVMTSEIEHGAIN